MLGFIRVGYKKHSFRDRLQNYYIKSALSVIDFYVHTSIQRKGYGKVKYTFIKEIFDKMIFNEKAYPSQLTYESINDTMLQFLNKCFNLRNYMLQNDGLLVFDGFFDVVSSANLLRSRTYQKRAQLISRIRYVIAYDSP